MGFVFSVDARQFSDGLKKYASLTGKNVRVELRKSMGSLSSTLIRLMVPATLAQGRKAVERDIRKIFTTPERLKLNNPKLHEAIAKAIKRGDLQAAQKILANAGRLSALTAKPLDPHDHRRRRNNRGRVKDQQPSIITSEQSLRRYIAEVQTHVGSAKAGWLPAAQKFGGKAPNFVSRHGGTAKGSATDALKGVGDRGFLEAVNMSGAANDVEQRLNLTARAVAATYQKLNHALRAEMRKAKAAARL